MAVNKVYKDNSQYLVLVFFFVPSQEAQLLGCLLDDTFMELRNECQGHRWISSQRPMLFGSSEFLVILTGSKNRQFFYLRLDGKQIVLIRLVSKSYQKVVSKNRYVHGLLP